MLHLLLAVMTLTSPDLASGVRVPRAFVWNRDGCDGANRTPRLHWTAPPRGTRAFALTVVDHDAPKPGGWVHWLVFDIPASARALDGSQPRGAIAGRNDFRASGWGGPCPPPGPQHHYQVELDALDVAPRFGPQTSLAAYRAQVRGHVLWAARIVPVYAR